MDKTYLKYRCIDATLHSKKSASEIPIPAGTFTMGFWDKLFRRTLNVKDSEIFTVEGIVGPTEVTIYHTKDYVIVAFFHSEEFTNSVKN